MVDDGEMKSYGMFTRCHSKEWLDEMYLPPDLKPGFYLVRSYYSNYFAGPVLTILCYIIEHQGKLRRCSLQ